MELNGIINTTAVRILRTTAQSKVFMPDLVAFLRETYKFVEYPKTLQEFADSKLEFQYGDFEDFIVNKVTLYNDGIYVQSPVSSEVLDRFIDKVISGVERKFGYKFEPATISKLYNSQIECTVKSGFSAWCEQFEPIINRFKDAVSACGVKISEYAPGGFSIVGEGPGEVKPGRFLFERRVDRALAENVFYSEAPLPTNEHIKLIEDLERSF